MMTTKGRVVLVAAVFAVSACEGANRDDGVDDSVVDREPGAEEDPAGEDDGTPAGDPDGNDPSDPDADPDPDSDPDSDPDTTRTTDQQLFNFTIVEDREQFDAHDLVYESSVGPYAVFRVTGPAPHLVGPYVVPHDNAKYAMLCAASGYFAVDEEAAENVRAVMFGDLDGNFELTSMPVKAEGSTDCPTAADIYTGDKPIYVEGEWPMQRLTIAFEPSPEQGSRVLLRLAGLTVANPGHNDSHAIPSICCDAYGDCALE